MTATRELRIQKMAEYLYLSMPGAEVPPIIEGYYGGTK
jgi:hypothetical protein